MRLVKEAVGLLMLGALLGCGWLFVRAHTDLGAPPLVYPCPPGSHTVRWWVPASSPQGRGAPGTQVWNGKREIASCAASLNASLPVTPAR